MSNSLHHVVASFCRAHHLKLNRDLGQHYLTDQEVLDAIVTAAKLETTDTVVEIGPGIGVLTRELLTRSKHVKAIEIDTRIISLLKQFILVESELDGKNLEIINDNALQVPMPTTPYKVVANIPYHITSPLLRHCFLQSSMYPTSLTLLIQKEVAEKICATKDAGMLTVLVSLFGTPRIVQHVPPKAFLPPPKVDSSVIHIDCFTEPIADNKTIEQIFTLTKLAFSQKRKMLRNSIGTLPNGMELLETSNIDPMRRPQTLLIEEWKNLANNYSSTVQ